MSFLIYLNEDFEGGETFFYAEDSVPEEKGEEAKADELKGSRPNQFAVGDVVTAIWSGDDDWYEATVLNVHIDEDGDVSYDVQFNDDEQEENGLHPSRVRSANGDGAEDAIDGGGAAAMNQTLVTQVCRCCSQLSAMMCLLNSSTLTVIGGFFAQASVDSMRKCAFQPRTGACVVFYSAEVCFFLSVARCCRRNKRFLHQLVMSAGHCSRLCHRRKSCLTSRQYMREAL